jgi:hypothetical protein
MGNKAVLVLPVVAAAGTAALLARGTRASGPGLTLMATVAALTFAPQAAYYARTGWYDAFFSHPARWMTGPQYSSAAQRLALLARLFIDAPELSPFSPTMGTTVVTPGEGALFVVGLGSCLAYVRRPLPAALLGWLLAGVAALLPDPAPNQMHHLVMVTAVPAAFAAMALATLGGRGARAILPLGLAVAVGAAGLYGYFLGNAGRWMGGEIAELGRAMHDYGPTRHLVLVTPPMSWDINSTLLYLAPGVRAEDKWTALPARQPWLAPTARDVAFIFTADRTPLVSGVRSRYPSGELLERRGVAGEILAFVYLVPAAEVARVEAAAAP